MFSNNRRLPMKHIILGVLLVVGISLAWTMYAFDDGVDTVKIERGGDSKRPPPGRGGGGRSHSPSIDVSSSPEDNHDNNNNPPDVDGGGGGDTGSGNGGSGELDLSNQIVASPAALEFLNKDSIMSNPSQDRQRKFFNGTRQFKFVCVTPKSDRLELQSMTSSERKQVNAALAEKYSSSSASSPHAHHHKVHNLNGFTFIDGDSFILRDVCALGHFPKELTHLFSYVWAEVLAHVDGERGKEGAARLKGVLASLGLDGDKMKKSDTNNNAEDPLDLLYQVVGPQLVHHLILGHRCATRTSPLYIKEATATLASGEKINTGHPKYTNVFHKVMAHWIRSIAFPWLTTREDREGGSGIVEGGSISTTKREKLLYRDLVKNGTMEEKMWPFGWNKAGAIPVGAPNAPPVSFYEDYTNGKAKRVCFERVLEREERWRWFPNAEVGHRFRALFWRYFRPLKQYHRRRLQKLTRIPFTRQEKVKVLILRREEDRHFDEKTVAQFIQDRFGHLAEIRMVQYDRGPHAAPNAVFPSYYEQMQQISQADIYIAAHGAALSSIVVMRPGAVVIELFPHNFRYYMYEELSKVLNIEYVPYEGTQVAPPRCCGGVNWGAREPAVSNNLVVAAGSSSNSGVAVNTSSTWSVPIDGGNEVDDKPLMKAVPRDERLKTLSKLYDLHGDRKCKKCDIYVPLPQWYHILKNALATVWLQNTRLTDIHDFDMRK